MKFVVFSDLHLDRSFRWPSPALARRLRGGIRETFGRICELAARENADALLCAGDLFEQESFTPDTMEMLCNAFGKLAPMPVALAPGNHDWYGPGSLYAHARWGPNVKVFDKPQLTQLPLGDGYVLWGAAHCAPVNTSDFLEHFRAAQSDWNVALFHGSERAFLTEQVEGKLPHAPFTEDEILSANLIHAFVGHYHRPKDGRWLTYPGAPQPLAFGEGQGTAVVAEFDGGILKKRRREMVSSIPFHDVAIDVSGMPSMSEIIKHAQEKIAGLTGVARITLRGSLAEAVELRLDDLQRIESGLEGIVARVADLVPDYNLDKIGAEQTVRGRFVSDVRASALSEEEKRRILTVGLRAFERREDLEPA
ncbi:MAG TPA: metallophosphoesterase [Candidatus Tyrphobacter sp.]